MYTRKTGTIAFQIGDNESSGRGTVRYRSINPTGAWNRHWPTILWMLEHTWYWYLYAIKQLTTQRQQCWSDHVFHCVSNKQSLNLITHWEQKRIHSYKNSKGRRRTKLELLNKLLTWKQTQHVYRSENATSDELERQTRTETEERKLNENGAAAGAGTRRSILRHLAQYCGTTSVVLTSAVAHLPQPHSVPY